MRRTYLPRIVGDKVMMPADLKRLHKYMVDVKHIGIISDEMREVVEELWPELGTQAAAEGVGSYFLSPRTINARKAGPWPLRQDAERLSRVHIHRETPDDNGHHDRFSRPDASRVVQRPVRHIPAHDLGTVAIKAALNRAKIAAEEVDEVIVGQSPHLDA